VRRRHANGLEVTGITLPESKNRREVTPIIHDLFTITSRSFVIIVDKVNSDTPLYLQTSIAQFAFQVKGEVAEIAGKTAPLPDLLDALLGGAEPGPYASIGVALQPGGSPHWPTPRLCQLGRDDGFPAA
jgi:hypothetical protein